MTQFTISAFYASAGGGVTEVFLKKKGERAFYTDQAEAESVAERMFEILPKARSVEVWQYGTGRCVKAFRREHPSQSETKK